MDYYKVHILFNPFSLHLSDVNEIVEIFLIYSMNNKFWFFILILSLTSYVLYKYCIHDWFQFILLDLYLVTYYMWVEIDTSGLGWNEWVKAQFSNVCFDWNSLLFRVYIKIDEKIKLFIFLLNNSPIFGWNSVLRSKLKTQYFPTKIFFLALVCKVWLQYAHTCLKVPNRKKIHEFKIIWKSFRC